MEIYQIVNMYNFHFDRRIYFENKTTFIDISSPSLYASSLICYLCHV